LGIISAIVGFFFCVVGAAPGIVTIVYASQVRSRWAAGDQQGALRASATARGWAIGGAVLTALVVIFFLLGLIGAFGGSSSP